MIGCDENWRNWSFVVVGCLRWALGNRKLRLNTREWRSGHTYIYIYICQSHLTTVYMYMSGRGQSDDQADEWSRLRPWPDPQNPLLSVGPAFSLLPQRSLALQCHLCSFSQVNVHMAQTLGPRLSKFRPWWPWTCAKKGLQKSCSIGDFDGFTQLSWARALRHSTSKNIC